MISFLRKKENVKKIMWGLAILIIPAFVLWGSGSAVRSRELPKYAGKIFGKTISFRQYEEALLACRNQLLLIYGEDFNKAAKFLDLEKEAWDRLILLYQAKKEKVKVADKEVIQLIEAFPLFQKEGRFNQARYNTLLGYAFRADPREFEEQIREMLKIDSLKDKVIAKVALSDEEIENVYRSEYELAKALYVLIEPQKFEEQIHPSYEQLQEYYQNYKTQFKKPDQVNVQYIALYFGQNDQEVRVSEEEMLDYYQEHIEEFSVKDKKEATLPLEEVKGQIKEKLIQNKARTLLEDRIWQIGDEIANEPGLFEEVAKKNQLEVKETGFFGPQQVIPEIGLSYEFLNAAFTMKIDEISNTIETSKGYFIIKVKEKKEPHIPPLDEVEEEVKAFVVMQKSWELAKSKAEEILVKLKDSIEEKKLNFSKAAEALSLVIEETEEFSRASYVSGIGQSPQFSQAAFALKPGEVSELIRVPNGYCILSLKEISPIDEEKFTREKEEFAKKLLVRKKDVFYQMWLLNLRKKAKLVSNIEKLKNRSGP